MSNFPFTEIKRVTSCCIKVKLAWVMNEATFSRFPVEKLSAQITSSPRLKKLSHRWEPIKPAPPVIKTLDTASPDRVIGEPEPLQLPRIVEVAPIENHRVLEHIL